MDDYERINAAEWDDSITLAQPSRPTAYTIVGPEEHGAKDGLHSQPRPGYEDQRQIQAKLPSSARRGPDQRRLLQMADEPLLPQAHLRRAPIGRRPLGVSDRPKQPHEGTGSALSTFYQANESRRESRQTHDVFGLIGNTQNTAEEQWRRRLPPAATVRITPEVAVSSLENRPWERFASENCAYAKKLHESKKTRAQTSEIGIWGDSVAVERTRVAINKWLHEWERTHRGTGTKSYAKISSLTPERWQFAEKQWQHAVKREHYRQHPPLDMPHASIGYFHWPSEEYCPEDTLGRSYEALDPIRMGCQCYIVWIPEISGFRVMGEPKSVRKALRRIRVAFFQLVARSTIVFRFHALRWSDHSIVTTHVAVAAYHAPACQAPGGQTPAQPADSPVGIEVNGAENDESSSYIQAELQLVKMKTTLANALRQMHHFLGSLQLRFRLGKLLLVTYRTPADRVTYSVSEYEDKTCIRGFKAEVTYELGDRSHEARVLQSVIKADDLFVSGYHHERLDDVEPTFAARFVFEDAGGDYCLFISWLKVEDRDGYKSCVSFERTSTTWVRCNAGFTGPQKLFDASLTDLKRRSSWAIELTATSQPLSEARIPQDLANFAESVKLDTTAALHQGNGRRFLRFEQVPLLKTARQITNYQFSLRDTDYILEITKFVDFIYRNAPQQDGLELPRMQEESWALNVYRQDWANMFAQNASLQAGEQVNWPDDLETWFPKDMKPFDEDENQDKGSDENSDDSDDGDDDDGFMQLIGKLNKVEQLVRS